MSTQRSEERLQYEDFSSVLGLWVRIISLACFFRIAR